jgi:hypothetical protein
MNSSCDFIGRVEIDTLLKRVRAKDKIKTDYFKKYENKP